MKTIKIILFSALISVFCLASCQNPWVTSILPDRDENKPVPEFPVLTLSPAVTVIGPEVVGYDEDDEDLEKTITITNSGNSAATVTDISLDGDDPHAFELVFDLNDINPIAAAGGTAEFTIKPAAGLDADTYTAVVTVTYDDDREAHAAVTFTVLPETVFPVTIQIDGNGTVTVNSEPVAHSESVPIEMEAQVTIEAAPANAGHQFKEWQIIDGDVILADLTENPAVFAMPGEAVTIKAVFEALIPNLSLSPSSIAFGTILFGEELPAARTITVTNDGNGAATITNIILGGTHSAAFAVSAAGTPIVVAADGGTEPFTVRPTATGVGSYSATVIVEYDGGAETNAVTLTFTINEMPVPELILSLDPENSQVVAYNYADTDIEPVIVTITNDGNGAAAISGIAITGDTAAFSWTQGEVDAITAIAAGGSADFTVQPELGLPVGTYTLAITVDYDDDAEADITISFEVTSAVPNINWSLLDGLEAFCGQFLSDVNLPERNSTGSPWTPGGFSWMVLDPDEIEFDAAGDLSFGVLFTPDDVNYNSAQRTVTVTVKAPVTVTITFDPIEDVLKDWSPGLTYDDETKTIAIHRSTGITINLTDNNYTDIHWSLSPGDFGSVENDGTSFVLAFDDDYDEEETYILTLSLKSGGVPYNRTIRIWVTPEETP
ncbi:MAG: choice-of-anchor D domain-containing protein [Treponema sp.]|nr:choice-of-anchor D domain-containing protein [Treponema sp.]